MRKEFRPLLVLLILYLAKRFADGGLNLGPRTKEAMKAFETALRPVADAVERETGISARLGIAQASLESGYGGSELSRPTAKLTILPSKIVGAAFNIFGFKTADAWLQAKKPYVMVPTNDYYKKGQKMPNGEIATADNQALKWPAPFRAYASWDESYRDWARLMQTPGYVSDGALAALQANNLDAFGKALSKRYAPNQNYDVRLAARATDMGLV